MYSSGTRNTIIIIGAYGLRAAAETNKKVPTGIRLRSSDRSQLANCSDAPINLCQIGPVTRQSRLIATLRSCASCRLLLFLFLGRKSVKCIFLEKI
jgi:LSD1 subclass zinc finger protein